MPLNLDDLPGHAGAVGLRLPDGSLTADEDHKTEPVAHRAMCSCGWSGSRDHPPTDTGRMSATSDWVDHMKPLWAAAPPGWLLNRSDSLRENLAELTTTWPLQALGVLAEVERWQRSLTEQAVTAARAAGASWTEVGAVLGVSRQAAHERFGAARGRKVG